MTMTKVIQTEDSQAVRIPKEFQFDVEDVEILQNGNELIIRKPRHDAGVIFEILTSFSGDFFAGGREQPILQERQALK